MAANMNRPKYKQCALDIFETFLKYLDEKPKSHQPKSEVLVERLSFNTLSVTTTLRDILNLMKKYQTLKPEFAPEDKDEGSIISSVVREGIKTLGKDDFGLLKDLRTEEEKQNNPCWKFELTFKDLSLSIQANLEYAEEKLGISLPQSDSSNGIDWHDICSQMLKEQRRATSNHLMLDRESNKKNIGEIYVPLAVVQKTKSDKRQRGNLSPDAGTSLYQPDYETKERFEHDAFLSQILERGEGKSKGKRISLIGEPGAGKTTLLLSIADWILKRELGFPVWISLADLVREENVTDIQTYIRDTWLEQTFSPPNLTEEVRKDFYSQIEQGKVWLLLDGVDEMLYQIRLVKVA